MYLNTLPSTDGTYTSSRCYTSVLMLTVI